ncbi:putative methyltransferase [Stachybotrys elegans]|uniref:Methyltransferase n=1 Tax=Stachybotrys elegans TaxID=80388 RepID=A0A8K0SV79_9HYPO|nr:putative methyltransferase [Stachybotrys elegans]
MHYSCYDYKYVFRKEVEDKRLQGQHQGFKLGMGRRLVLAPIDLGRPNLRIFDGGTSDGYWLGDLVSELGQPETCELIGGDITPERFPENPPHGIKLYAQDSAGPYPEDWLGSFDLVHQRLTLVGVGPKAKECVLEMLKLVKPGGWIQLVEIENTNEPNGPCTNLLGYMVIELGKALGSDLTYRDGGMEKWIAEAGFRRVGHMIAPVCLGAECHEPKLKEQTVEAFCFTAAQLIPALKRIKCMTAEESDTFVERLAEELRTRGGYFPIRVVWAQRPPE